MDNTTIAITAALISGLLGVLITLFLQKRTATYNRKMNVFETLMIYRAPETLCFKESVHALNSIDVIFYEDTAVRNAYKDFINETNKPEEMHPNIQDKHLRMLEVMAKSLGLKKLCWENIKNPYFPKGYSEILEDEKIMRKSSIMNNIESYKLTHEFNNRQSTKEEKVQNVQ